jgi:hypothetical protein
MEKATQSQQPQEKSLFLLRYRKGTVGVQTGFISARNLETATEVGRKWCGDQINCRYISVTPAVIADESILESPKVQEKKAS